MTADSNLSTLQRNILHALDCEASESAFLRACDRLPVLAAETFAYEVRELVRTLSPMLLTSAKGYGLDDVPTGLLKFILDRHWHSRFPGN